MSKEISQKNIRSLTDPIFVREFFNQRLKKYFPRAKEVSKIAIESLCGFLGTRNLKLKYVLSVNFGNYQKRIIIHARARKRKKCIYDSPQRQYLFLKYLWENGFQKIIGQPLDYLKDYNLVLYKHIEGKSLQSLLEQGKINLVLKYIPQIAVYLKKIHQVKIKQTLPIKNRYLEIYDHRHWLFILKKSYPLGVKRVREVLNELNILRKKHSILFGNEQQYTICHGDPHLGNFLITNRNKLKMIDLSEAYIYDSLDDVARFLVQS
ncbi:phosphotransferase [bacterium]|nr:phosphotransferase [bacterium]